MEKRKTWVWMVLAGAFVGGALTTWLAPKVIAWYFEPPAQFGFNCVAPIDWALTRMKWSQAIGSVSGAILGLVLYFSFAKRRQDNYVIRN